MRSDTQKGELFLLITIVMEGLYPVLVEKGIAVFPPIFFGAISSFVASFFLFWYLVLTGTLRKGLSKEVFGYILMVVLFIIVMGHIFVFIGAQYTTGINVGLLLRFELVSTPIVGYLLMKERLQCKERFGAFLILVGTFFLLYNGSFSINKGDALIILATMMFPFGNMFAKKALQHIGPMALLFWRYCIGGFILLLITPFVEPHSFSLTWTRDMVLMLLFFGTIMLIASKAAFYKGLRCLQMTNIIFQVAAGASALTLVFSYLFLSEVPSTFQWIGFAVSIAGAYCMTKGRASQPLSADHV